MSIERIRVGIVGAGANTISRHIPGLRSIDGVEITSVCNRSPESSDAVARRFGIPKTRRHWTDLAGDPELDAVVIGTWPNLHCPVTLAALAAGKHVLCEARMAMNAREAAAMRGAARARPGLVAQVVPAPMTLHVDGAIRRLLADGAIGETLAVEVRDAGGYIDRDAPLHWRQETGRSGMNVMTLGIWYETVMRWVGEATRVMAMGRTFAAVRRDGGGLLKTAGVPDHIDVLAEMACGAQARFGVSRVAGHAPPPEAVLHGSEGTLRFSEGRLFAARRGEEGWREIAPDSGTTDGWRVEAEFIGAIRGEEPVRFTTFEDGVKYMEFTEAVHRSRAAGSAVALPLAI